MISQEDLRRLIAAVDLAGLIGQYVDLKPRSGGFQGLCPFHAEKSPSFHIYCSDSEEHHYHCYGCGQHGHAINFLMEHDGIDFLSAVRQLAKTTSLELETHAPKGIPSLTVHRTMSTLDKAAANFTSRLASCDGERGAAELVRRGISAKTIDLYRLGCAPDAWDGLTSNPSFGLDLLVEAGLARRRDRGPGGYDLFRDRLMFPILDSEGRPIGFGGRKLGAEDSPGPKYLNSPETAVFKKGAELFGWHQARTGIRKSNSVIVVEGYFDVLTPAQYGIKNVVSPCGTAITLAQIERILGVAKQITFCFDGDAAGRAATWRAANLLWARVQDEHEIRFATLPGSHDPDSMVREAGLQAFVDLVANAPTLAQYVGLSLIEQAKLDTPEGRAWLVRRAVAFCEQSQAKIVSFFFRKMVCQAAGISELEFDELGQLVA